MEYKIVVTEKNIATYIVEADSNEEAEAALHQGDLNPKTHTIEEYSEEVTEVGEILKKRTTLDMGSIDWGKLRTQKDGVLMAGGNLLDGLVELIDHIQDEAVKTGQATELEVFGNVVCKNCLEYSVGECENCAETV